MNMCIRICATLSLALLAQHAAAIPVLRNVQPTFLQNSNGTLRAGLSVEASTGLPVLVIAGGFTITCSTSPIRYNVERRSTYSSFFGPRETLLIPEGSPGTYEIPNWSSIPAGTCTGHCIMEYTAEATDVSSLSIRVGNAGVGANFTLIPSGTQLVGDSKLVASICRSGRPQCCTPGCVIP